MNEITTITGRTLEIAWAKAYASVTQTADCELCPLFVTISEPEFSDPEGTNLVRIRLDETLSASGKATTTTVANTLFPWSLWNPKREHTCVYDRYRKHVLPSIKRDNPKGTYFQRIIDYCPEGLTEPVNQLEQIIETWKDHHNHRHSALQISIFDPTRDHVHNQRLGFPCLHQICFTPHGENGCEGLSVTAFYATQHIWTKGYGNYLGLIRLGRFVANVLGLRLLRVSCMAGKAVVGIGHSKDTRNELRELCINTASQHDTSPS